MISEIWYRTLDTKSLSFSSSATWKERDISNSALNSEKTISLPWRCVLLQVVMIWGKFIFLFTQNIYDWFLILFTIFLLNWKKGELDKTQFKPSFDLVHYTCTTAYFWPYHSLKCFHLLFFQFPLLNWSQLILTTCLVVYILC